MSDLKNVLDSRTKSIAAAVGKAIGETEKELRREFNGKLAALEIKLAAATSQFKFKGRFKGAWIDGQEYMRGDFVIHDGGALFWASADTTNSPSSGVDWVAANR